MESKHIKSYGKSPTVVQLVGTLRRRGRGRQAKKMLLSGKIDQRKLQNIQ